MVCRIDYRLNCVMSMVNAASFENTMSTKVVKLVVTPATVAPLVTAVKTGIAAWVKIPAVG